MSTNPNPTRYIGPYCDPNGHFLKITNAEENHKGFQYQDGLNVLRGEFSIKGSCVGGGLYFTDARHIYEFLTYGIHLRDITLPTDDPDLKMVEDGSGGKWRANKVILGTRYDLSKIETHEYLLSMGAPAKLARIEMIKIAGDEKNLDLAKYLLRKHGISPNDIHSLMLTIVLKEQNPELAKSLIDLGVPSDQVTYIIFKIAIVKKDWNAVKSLIKDIGFLEEGEMDSIIESDDVDLVKLVIDRNFVCSRYSRNSIFDMAIEKESMDLINLCIQKGYHLGCYQKTLDENLYEAVYYDQSDAATFLVKCGAKVRILNDRLIVKAVENNSLSMVKFLVENKINFKTNDEQPLRLASEKGYLDIVKYLVEKGSNIRVKNNDPIYLAVCKNQLETVKFLHSQGAKLGIRNDLLIITAAEKGYLPVVKYLVENGVSPTVRNNLPAKKALQNGYKKVARYLENAKN